MNTVQNSHLNVSTSPDWPQENTLVAVMSEPYRSMSSAQTKEKKRIQRGLIIVPRPPFCLQGHIWREGYDSGELKGQLFPEVAAELQKWHSQGMKVYIYSSGSREAQRLLFANSVNGDLRGHICGFFDTAVGPKVCTAR